jgi:hypothetical protein
MTLVCKFLVNERQGNIVFIYLTTLLGAQTTASNDRVANELERICKEVVVA